MFDKISLKEMLIIIGCIMLFTAVIIPLIKKIAFHINALDIPDARKVHNKPMPRLGGLGIFLGFLLGSIICGLKGVSFQAILIAGFIIVITGIIDDIKPLKARYKLVGQLLSVMVLVFYGDILMSEINILGLYIDFKWTAYIVTPIFMLGIINAMNLIDGLDGLMAGTSSVFFITVIVINLLTPKLGTFSLILALIMLGTTLGFLIHNFYPAKIFAGDSGSMFVGMMISVISLMGFKTATVTSLFVPILILAIPLIDTACAFLRRVIKKQPFYMPDKQHLHHQLLNMGLSHRNTVLVIYLMNILFATASIVYFTQNRVVGKYIYIAILILIVWLITRTSIIRDKKKLKDRK